MGVGQELGKALKNTLVFLWRETTFGTKMTLFFLVFGLFVSLTHGIRHGLFEGVFLFILFGLAPAAGCVWMKIWWNRPILVTCRDCGIRIRKDHWDREGSCPNCYSGRRPKW